MSINNKVVQEIITNSVKSDKDIDEDTPDIEAILVEPLDKLKAKQNKAEKAQKDADKVAEKARKDADKVAEKARKDADKVAEKAKKDAEKVAEKSRKDADKVAEKARKDADKVAEKAQKDADKTHKEVGLLVQQITDKTLSHSETNKNYETDNETIDIISENVTEQYNNEFYNKVIASELFETKDSNGNRKQILILKQEEFKDTVNNHKYLYEIIGGSHQIKPIFDVEFYLQKSIFRSKKETSISKQLETKSQEIVGDIIQKLNLLFPNKPIKICKRQPRVVLHLKEDYYKISLHFIVLNVRITAKNLLNYLITHQYTNDKPFDLSIYSHNHLLSLPYTTKPDNKKNNDYNVPLLLPVFNNDVNNIFDYCASYIKADYEDYDLKFENVEEVDLNKKSLNYDKKTNEDVDFDDENDKTTDFIYNKLTNEILPLFTENRSDTYDTWIKGVWCFINICNKNKISRTKCYTLVHQFSKLSKNYEEEKVDEWLDKNFDNTNTEKGYGWGYLYNTCLKEDNPDYYEKNLKKSYKKVKEEWEKKASKLRDPVGFIVINDAQDEFNQKPYIIYSKSELLTAYEDMKCWIVNEKNKWVKKDFIPLWLKDENISVYNDVIFRPYIIKDVSKKHFNLFKGLRVSNLKICRNYDIILPILEHIKTVISKNREDVYTFVIQYFAQIIQHPDNKTNVVMLIKGRQGCGKNIIIDLLANGIIGTEYSVSTANPERVFFGNFNSLLGNKILAVMNEAGNNVRDCMDRMKDIATAPTINVEKKGKDPLVFDNYINMIGTTNNFNSIDITVDDRRCIYLECDNNYIGNVEYFNKLARVCMDEEAISSFYHYLKEEVKITITDFQKSRPITLEYKRIQKLNINNVYKFLSDYNEIIYKNYKGVSSSVIQKGFLYTKYKLWCENVLLKPYNKPNFEERLLIEFSGITECLYEGNKSFRFTEIPYKLWLKQWQILDDDIEKVTKEEVEFIDD